MADQRALPKPKPPVSQVDTTWWKFSVLTERLATEVMVRQAISTTLSTVPIRIRNLVPNMVRSTMRTTNRATATM